jgi:type IV pilus assembly protein PilF
MYNIFNERATQHFDHALQLDPHYGLARVIRAETAPGLAPDDRRAQEEQAVVDAAAGPNQEVLNILAWRAKDPQERRILLQALVALSPTTATYAYRLAMTETEPQARIAALQKVATDFPDFEAVHNVLAYNLWDAGDHDGALREVQQYLKMNPDHPNPHDSYAELLQRSGRYQEALEHYGHAIAKDPSFSEAYAGRAEVYQIMGKPAQARAEWQQAIAHAVPSDKAGHTVAIAGSYLLEGNRKMALASLGDAMKLAPANMQGTGHAFMAMAEGSGGGKEAARHHLSEVDAGTSPLFAGLAAIYAGDTDAARAAATRAAEAKAPAEHVLKSILASQAGDIATAQQELQAVPANNQALTLARAFLAEALARAGRKAEAQPLRDQVKADDVSFLDDLAVLKVRKL